MYVERSMVRGQSSFLFFFFIIMLILVITVMKEALPTDSKMQLHLMPLEFH